jgi:hypothetical protein
MATSGTYYLNAPSLGSATSVFDDVNLTILASDGFYSDGIIAREQVSGVLLPQQTCPSCVSYNCVEGTCTDPGDGTGEYATLEACELACAITYPCECVRLENTTIDEIFITITPCDTGVPFPQGVPGNSVVTECIVTGSPAGPEPGIIVTYCPGVPENPPCNDEMDCGLCGAP